MNPIQLPTGRHILIDQKFYDFYEFKEAARIWDLDFMLTSKHGFKANFHYSIINCCLLGHVALDCNLEQSGLSPTEMRTFVIPSSDKVNYSWRRHSISGQTLQLFPLNRELHSISNPSFDCYIVSFPVEHFNQIMTQLGYDPYMRSLANERVWKVDRETVRCLRSICMSYEKGEIDPEYTLLKTLINSLLRNDDNYGVELRSKNEVLNLINQNLQEHREEVFRMSELVKLTGKSERTIQYAFQKEYGTTPFEYIKSKKLHWAYKDLMENPDLSITDIANRNGFWHMGQFAADFKAQFAFLPSERRNWTKHMV